MDIKFIEEIIYGHRKELNKRAEVSNKEYETSKYIREYLKSIDISCETYINTATVGIIKGKNPKKTIAFRADIDGLLINDKVKHLCGHDGHTSILLGLIEYIKLNIDSLVDNIVFIFQPAEEQIGGAKRLIDEGIFEKYNIDEIYGLHIYPEINEKTIGIRKGYFMSQIGDMNISIRGKGGHAAIPEKAIDSILICSYLINNLQSIVSRSINPQESGVITIGKINGGSKRNIIADEVKLEGTIRTFDPTIYNNIKNRIKDICRGMEYSYGCEIKVEIIDDYPSVNNDVLLYEEFIEALSDENILKLKPLMIAEDFSYYQQKVKGLFFMLGSRNEYKGYTSSLHNINFDFDEKVLTHGINIYIKLLKYKESII